jgi:hypothetical protein
MMENSNIPPKLKNFEIQKFRHYAVCALGGVSIDTINP